MSILALDIATKTGWAHTDGSSGVWNFSKRKTSALKVHSLYESLSELVEWLPFSHIVAESVHYGFLTATALLNQYRGAVMAWCVNKEVEFIENSKLYTATAIKKWSTGKGHASKDEMIERANKLKLASAAPLRGSRIITDDNEADAICLLHYHQSLAAV
jgi:Holliday junction resolvasome RuvABC endonuclease subunit